MDGYMENTYWFKSELFEIQKDEDKDTNPGCYGKSLAEWLCQKFEAIGYEASVIPEDWGWCVMCVYGEYMLSVGCGPMQTEEYIKNIEMEIIPNKSDIVWHVFTTIEIPFFFIKSLLRKWTGSLDLETPHNKLKSELHKILNSESGIAFCEEP